MTLQFLSKDERTITSIFFDYFFQKIIKTFTFSWFKQNSLMIIILLFVLKKKNGRDIEIENVMIMIEMKMMDKSFENLKINQIFQKRIKNTTRQPCKNYFLSLSRLLQENISSIKNGSLRKFLIKKVFFLQIEN